MPLIVKYKNGDLYKDWTATSHDDEEDSYSIADAVNSILRDVQFSLEREGVFLDYELSEKFGVESVGWGEYYTPPENDEIANFLQRFHNFEHDVTHTFVHGCCYWFAVMMHARFPQSRIMYAYKIKPTDEELAWIEQGKIDAGRCFAAMHFVTEINGRLYDITGDVTDKYEVKPWDEVQLAERQRIESHAVFWKDDF